jgi:hypothetical protein
MPEAERWVRVRLDNGRLITEGNSSPMENVALLYAGAHALLASGMGPSIPITPSTPTGAGSAAKTNAPAFVVRKPA